MPKVKANGVTLNYEIQGVGEPLILIPFLSADNACYAFQVADYAKRFTCISIDPRGAGESDKPAGVYSMELFADDVAALMQAIGVERAHISGVSLGAATGLWLAAKHPHRVKTLSLHSGWPKTDPFLKTVVEGWRSIAKGLDSVPETVIQGIFPWCFTPEFYSAKTDYIEQLAAFVRSRPKQPLDAFMRQSSAVIAHDAQGQLARIKAPTQITFGRHDIACSPRFADAMTTGIAGSELLVFETCAHAAIYQSVAEFNEKTLHFLNRHVG
jgi:pimeloyl-ACP methyl ester carboxylesterase